MWHELRAKWWFILVAMPLTATAVMRSGLADEPSLKKQELESLSQLQVLIGSWRGVGQPRRGSSRDSWIEGSTWQWSFSDGKPALEFAATKGRFYRQGRITALTEEGQFQLDVTRADNEHVERFRGSLDKENQLILSATDGLTGPVARISIRTVADGDRLLMLLERRTKPKGRYSRIAEIGYTRKGSGFGQGTTQRECIVTGGLGNIAVTYKGRTYYVCCGGCRDLFEDDPEGVLAEYKERLREKKANQKGSAHP